MIESQKEVLNFLDKSCSDYDYLLDRYEMGTGAEMYDSFFARVKEKLLPLIREIQERGRKIDDSVLFADYDVKEQEAFLEELKDYMQVDRDCCYMGVSEHPFTEFFSAKESRITTHYHKNSLMSAILSTVHEYGHALYALQVEEKYDGTALKDAIGSAMHESQSRLMENHIGRNPAFWESNYPKLQKRFPDKLGNISLEHFMEMVNVSRPSLIRTEADELTYPVHVLIRYELEKEIFGGHVSWKSSGTTNTSRISAFAPPVPRRGFCRISTGAPGISAIFRLTPLEAPMLLSFSMPWRRKFLLWKRCEREISMLSATG